MVIVPNLHPNILIYMYIFFYIEYIDQTPTPTRFLKNCEEVGLFNELASPFENDFKKASDDDIKKVHELLLAVSQSKGSLTSERKQSFVLWFNRSVMLHERICN